MSKQSYNCISGAGREKQDFINHSSGTVEYIPKPVAVYLKWGNNNVIFHQLFS